MRHVMFTTLKIKKNVIFNKNFTNSVLEPRLKVASNIDEVVNIIQKYVQSSCSVIVKITEQFKDMIVYRIYLKYPTVNQLFKKSALLDFAEVYNY